MAPFLIVNCQLLIVNGKSIDNYPLTIDNYVQELRQNSHPESLETQGLFVYQHLGFGSGHDGLLPDIFICAL